MSPLRIETERTTRDGTKIRTVQSASRTFPLIPSETRDLLGLSESGVRSHIYPEERHRLKGQRETSFTHYTTLYDDRTLLRIAAETTMTDEKLEAKRHASGLTQLVGKDKSALLDIPWEEAEKIIEQASKE